MKKNVEWTLKHSLKEYRKNDYENNLKNFFKKMLLYYVVKEKKKIWEDIAQTVTVIIPWSQSLGRGLGEIFEKQETSIL